MVEEVSDLDADGTIRGRLLPLHRPLGLHQLWLFKTIKPHTHVQRVSLLVPLPQFLQKGLQSKET